MPPQPLRDIHKATPGALDSTLGVPSGSTDTANKPTSRQKKGDSTDFCAPNIILYGETGVGKSSIINLIAGQQVAHTSNDIFGYPLRHHWQRYIVELDGMPCALWDTIGLGEERKTTGSTPSLVESNLKSLIKDLAETRGIHLLVYCARAGKFTKALKRNYDLFYVTVCRKKVPVALVVTGLEHQLGEMETWWTVNEAVLKRSGMRFDAHACVTTLDIEDRVVQERRLHSQRILSDLVIQYSRLPTWKADLSFMSCVLPTLRTALRETMAMGRMKKSISIRKVIARDTTSSIDIPCIKGPTTTPLQVDSIDIPDLTDTLKQGPRRLAGTGSFSVVYRCLCTLQNGERTQVAVKAISFGSSIARNQKEEFLRKMRRELGLWKRFDHPNIVPLLGTAHGNDFGSDHPCMVSMWMPCGTLAQYVGQRENWLSLHSRIRLVTGSAAGLEYLHSQSILHGDFHPGNILIDSDHNPRLTDFGFSQTLSPQNNLTYLWTNSVRPGAVMWVAPELLYPDLFSDAMIEPKVEPNLNVDIYSLGSIILFTISGKFPWNISDVESKLEQLQNPPRPFWPVIPDSVWEFIERCWSPRAPGNRPSAHEVLAFSRDQLQQLLQPNPASDVSVVLFGAQGCGKSSIINLIAGEPVAAVSTNVDLCAKRLQFYPVSIAGRRFRLWDPTGIPIPPGDADPLSLDEQVLGVLRDVPDDIHLILLCVHKDEISSSFGDLYRSISHFFGGRAPIAIVVTHFDIADEQWWDLNHRFIVSMTGIPIQHIPHACTTMVGTGRNLARQTMRTLLKNCANSATPIPLRLDFSPPSHEGASSEVTTGSR